MIIDDDRFYEAIRDGVADAMWRMMTNATDAPCADFYEHVKQGIAEGMRKRHADRKEA